MDMNTIVDEHGDFLYTYGKTRVHSADDLEDILQETFLAALTAKDAFREESTVRTWLVSILRNKIFDYYKRKSKDSAVLYSDSLDDIFDSSGHWKPAYMPKLEDDTVFARVSQRELRGFIQKCLQKLPDTLRTAYILREVDDYKTEEICKKLSLTVTNLNVIIHRARINLRKCLTEHDISGE